MKYNSEKKIVVKTPLINKILAFKNLNFFYFSISALVKHNDVSTQRKRVFEMELNCLRIRFAFLSYNILSTFEETLSTLQQLPLYVLAEPLTICATERLASEFSLSYRQILICTVAYLLAFSQSCKILWCC